jgi:hypothetical protein
MPEPIRLFDGHWLAAAWLAEHSTFTDLALDLKPFCTSSSAELGRPLNPNGPVAVMLTLEAFATLFGDRPTETVAPLAIATAPAGTSTTSVVNPIRFSTARQYAEAVPQPSRASVGPMPRLWFWTQAAIVVFVLIGMVIAITKLA